MILSAVPKFCDNWLNRRSQECVTHLAKQLTRANLGPNDADLSQVETLLKQPELTAAILRLLVEFTLVRTCSGMLGISPAAMHIHDIVVHFSHASCEPNKRDLPPLEQNIAIVLRPLHRKDGSDCKMPGKPQECRVLGPF
jgi:hypothetical protein